MSLKRLSQLLERFLESPSDLGPWEWDDYISVRKSDSTVEEFRLRIISIGERYPSEVSGNWCSAEGMMLLQELSAELKGMMPEFR